MANNIAVIFGEWKMVSAENQDEFLKAMGMDLMARKLAGSIKPTYKYEDAGDGKIKQIIVVPIRNMELVFEWGKELEDVSPRSGRKSKHIVTWEDDKKRMRHVHKLESENLETLTFREFTQDEMIVTSSIGSVVSTMKFKRVK